MVRKRNIKERHLEGRWQTTEARSETGPITLSSIPTRISCSASTAKNLFILGDPGTGKTIERQGQGSGGQGSEKDIAFSPFIPHSAIRNRDGLLYQHISTDFSHHRGVLPASVQPSSWRERDVLWSPKTPSRAARVRPGRRGLVCRRDEISSTSTTPSSRRRPCIGRRSATLVEEAPCHPRAHRLGPSSTRKAPSSPSPRRRHSKRGSFTRRRFHGP